MSYLKQYFQPNSQKPVPITLTFLHNKSVGDVPFAAFLTGLTMYKSKELKQLGGRYRKTTKFSLNLKEATNMHEKGGAHIFLFDENDDIDEFIYNYCKRRIVCITYIF